MILIFLLPFIYFLYLLVMLFLTGVPIVLTNKKYLPVIFAEMPIPEGSIVYELGCGLAGFLFSAEKYNPKKLIGYGLSPIHVFLVNLKAKILKSKVGVYWQDFFKADISEADYIYLFLVKKVQYRVWLKIAKEAKRGAFVLTLSDSISGEKPYKVFKAIPENSKSPLFYVYRVK